MGAPPPYPRPYPRIASRCSGRGPTLPLGDRPYPASLRDASGGAPRCLLVTAPIQHRFAMLRGPRLSVWGLPDLWHAKDFSPRGYMWVDVGHGLAPMAWAR